MPRPTKAAMNNAGRAVFVAFALVLGAGAASTLAAQTVRVGENVQVTTDFPQRPLAEPHLTTNPANPAHLLAATIVSDASDAYGPSQFCAAFLSTDGGREWTRHDFPVTECGDPWVAITPDGQAVFTAIGVHVSITKPHQPVLLVYHSADGGRTWDATPTSFGRGHDHPTFAVDASARRKGWLYLVSEQRIRDDQGRQRAAVFVARSRNGGRTFDEPVKVVPSNLAQNAEMPVVLSDGTLAIAFGDFARLTARGRLERSREWVLRSIDGGHSFSVPLFVTEACGPPWTALAADTGASSAFRDRLYHSCLQRGGGAVLLSASMDGGESWTAPVRVHGAAADTTVSRNPFAAVAVSPAGVVAVAWLDSRSFPKKRCQEMYFAASLDGGTTFLSEQRVSAKPSCPDSSANGAAQQRWPSGGDYFGMVAASDGLFHLIWPDARDGVFQLYAATIAVDGKARPAPGLSRVRGAAGSTVARHRAQRLRGPTSQ